MGSSLGALAAFCSFSRSTSSFAISIRGKRVSPLFTETSFSTSFENEEADEEADKEAEDPNTKYYSHEEFKQMARRIIDGEK